MGSFFYAQNQGYKGGMIVLGVVLIVLWLVTKVAILLWIGVALAVIGVLLLLLGAGGRTYAGRRYWY